MTRDDVIRMAREAGVASETIESFRVESLVRFAALVAAAEREACAAICKTNGDEWSARSPRRQHHTGAGIGALACYDQIIARGKEAPAQTCCKGGPQWGHAWDCPELP